MTTLELTHAADVVAAEGAFGDELGKGRSRVQKEGVRNFDDAMDCCVLELHLSNRTFDDEAAGREPVESGVVGNRVQVAFGDASMLGQRPPDQVADHDEWRKEDG